MKKRISVLILAIVSFLFGLADIHAQAPEETITWSSKVNQIEDGLWEVIYTGKILDGWHTYTLKDKYSPVTVEYSQLSGCTAEGEPYELSKTVDFKGEKVTEGTIIIAQKFKTETLPASVSGEIGWRSCDDTSCATPESWEFKVDIKDPSKAEETAIVPAENKENASDNSSKDNKSIWGFILEAILWGLAMVLTPCVFPMVPMTISFFLKGSSSVAAGRFKAFMYGLFIVLIYTIPICLIIFATWIIGGEAVTADIFNWLATHWLPNLIFFAVFMIFALSFFGAFEIVLPSSLVNKTDAKSDKKGLAGVFFMALTLVLVSFSCTGPIVGTVLIKSTEGEFWTPMVTMLAFSIAFALPFTLLAFFPSVLKKFKNATWLNSVKIVFGFIEVALGFKFLSTADQTYHWGLLDREVYLAIWITTFTLLGFYLLGKIRFKNDAQHDHISIVRLILSIVVFTFVTYMIPGMFGAPLKALSGYLPPIETQDFVINTEGVIPAAPAAEYKGLVGEPDLELPHGLKGFSSLDAAFAAAKAAGKPVFVDITGHGCVNCREMEARVWSDPKVREMLANDYVIAALYTDDKIKLPESQWITDENGKVFKDTGKVNSYIARTRFGVNAQPNYVLLSSDGKQLAPVRGYDLDVDAFVAFLKQGL